MFAHGAGVRYATPRSAVDPLELVGDPPAHHEIAEGSATQMNTIIREHVSGDVGHLGYADGRYEVRRALLDAMEMCSHVMCVAAHAGTLPCDALPDVVGIVWCFDIPTSF